MADTGSGPGTVNLTALTVGVAGVATVLGGLSQTGTVGRVLRDEPFAMGFALSFVLIGGGLLVLAGLPAAKPRGELWLSVLGLVLTVGGIVIAALGAVTTAGLGERPGMTASMTEDGSRLTGTVKAANLRSKARLVVLVVAVGSKGEASLHRADIGPDSDGDVEYTFTAGMPSEGYAEIRIASWSTLGRKEVVFDDEVKRTTTCERLELVRGAQATARPSADTACIVLPAPTQAGPGAPRAGVAWQGRRGDVKRVDVRLTTTNAPAGQHVALAVTGRKGRRWTTLYRATFPAGADGALSRRVRIPIPAGTSRLCVGAAYVTRGFPGFQCTGRLGELVGADRTTVRLKLPGAVRSA